MKIIVTGASGFIGKHLSAYLADKGHQIIHLHRNSKQGDDCRWEPEVGFIDTKCMEGADALIHLAGEPLANGRWTKSKKTRITKSRESGTSLLVKALTHLTSPPSVFISASAIGYYGHRGPHRVTEADPKGNGYLANVCAKWEAASVLPFSLGIRVVNPRLGLVIGNDGLLARLLPLFKKGLGGKLGSGKQYMSWISLEDTLEAFNHLLVSESLKGPVNLVAPKPVTNREFTWTLSRVLKICAHFPAPAFALKLAFGQMAREMILSSTKALPQKLEQSGFTFIHKNLESALRAALTNKNIPGATPEIPESKEGMLQSQSS
ncbi:MAG: TIGR01777 family protein [Fibrobacteria bacterium]|nr:TIGR01777 family protein [Fibrobacteria bacterium]